MIRGAAGGRPALTSARARAALSGLGVLAIVLALVPPVSSHVGSYAFVEALQYGLLALVAPALIVVGAPWTILRLASAEAAEPMPPETGRVADRLAVRRQRLEHYAGAYVYLVLFAAVEVVWRIPALVDALARHPLLALAEAVTVVPVGVGLWLELIGSPPFVPRCSRPHRMGLAAVTTWITWLLAYALGFSRSVWFHAYVHTPGHGLSLNADQELTAGVLWFISFCCFVPVVFGNLVRWLRSEENPDEELRNMLREQRRRGGPLT